MSKQSRAISTILAVVVVIIIIAAAAGAYYLVSTSSSTTTTTSSSSSSSTSTTAVVNVQIVPGASIAPSVGYSPDTITVVLGVNATVVWTNGDTVYHTVTSNTGDPVSFTSSQSPGIAPGGTYEYTFTVAGTRLPLLLPQ